MPCTQLVYGLWFAVHSTAVGCRHTHVDLLPKSLGIGGVSQSLSRLEPNALSPRHRGKCPGKSCRHACQLDVICGKNAPGSNRGRLVHRWNNLAQGLQTVDFRSQCHTQTLGQKPQEPKRPTLNPNTPITPEALFTLSPKPNPSSPLKRPSDPGPWLLLHLSPPRSS